MDYPLYAQLERCDFVLASTSPRRLDILREMRVPHIRVVAPDFAENLDKAGTPEEYVTATALGKMELVWPAAGGLTVVLAADTVVVHEGRIYEKPATQTEQLRHLRRFRESALPVRVITAVHVWGRAGERVAKAARLAVTTLTFDRALSDAFLEAYVNSGEGTRAAGGFKIQGVGGLLWGDVRGDYRNVVGLPFKDTFEALEEVLHCLQLTAPTSLHNT